MSFRHMTPQSFALFLSFIENLETVVFWMCEAEYQRLHYLNRAYEKCWGRSCESLYRNLADWRNTLLPEDGLSNEHNFLLRSNNIGESIIKYRVVRPNGEICYIKDTAFSFPDPTGKPFIIAGISEMINEAHWDKLNLRSSDSLSNNHLASDIFKILQHEMKIKLDNSFITLEDINVLHTVVADRMCSAISPRQLQCLQYLLAGKSAKETACLLQLSTRTIEGYLGHLRKKFNCRSNIALISRINALIYEKTIQSKSE